MPNSIGRADGATAGLVQAVISHRHTRNGVVESGYELNQVMKLKVYELQLIQLHLDQLQLSPNS